MKAPDVIRQNESVRVVVRTPAELFEEGQDDKGKYVGGKWGGMYLRAPDIFFRTLEKAGDKLVRLGDVAKVYGYIHDNNTGEQFQHVPFLKSLKNALAIKVDETSPGVIMYGVMEKGKSRLEAPILFARTFGDRLFAIFNPCGVFGKEFYKVLPNDNEASNNDKLLAALLNASWSLLQLELYGVANLGGGALKFARHDIRLFILPTLPAFNDQYVRLLSAFDSLSQRPIRSVFEELGFTLCQVRRCPHAEHPYEHVHPEELALEQVQEASPDRFELDRIIFDVLGLTDEERLEVYRAVAQLVKERLTKAQSNTNGN